jgi:hypothetical protein
MAFEKTVPQWDAAGTEPPSTLKASGFTAGYKPPAAYFNWFWHSVSQCLSELQSKNISLEEALQELLDNMGDLDYLPLTGGVLSGALTVKENFNINKSYDDVEYKTFVRPINYSVANNGDYSTGLIHYKGEVSQAQLMFNKDGVMLRDNVAGKAYQLFGQHKLPAASSVTAGTFAGQVIANSSGQTVGTMLLRNSKLVNADTTPTVNGEICWTYK